MVYFLDRLLDAAPCFLSLPQVQLPLQLGGMTLNQSAVSCLYHIKAPRLVTVGAKGSRRSWGVGRPCYTWGSDWVRVPVPCWPCRCYGLLLQSCVTWRHWKMCWQHSNHVAQSYLYKPAIHILQLCQC